MVLNGRALGDGDSVRPGARRRSTNHVPV